MPMQRLRSLLALLVLAPGAAASDTWHVDASAPSPGLGTEAQPWTSLAYAVQQPVVHSGDTLLVAPGAYVPPTPGLPYFSLFNLTIRGTAGAAATRLITFMYVTDGSVLEGFTVEDEVALAYGAQMHRCVVVCPSNDCHQIGRRAVFADENALVENCVLSGYQIGIRMHSFAIVTATARNTIFDDVETVGATSGHMHLDHCAMESFAVQGNVTQSGTLLGETAAWTLDPANSDFHLMPGSACIEAGVGLDPDGTPADIGAFPFDPAHPIPPVSYCEGLTTSDGCLAGTFAAGLCIATSPDPFLVQAFGVSPNRIGRLLYSLGQASTPFQGGTLCLALPLTRTPASNSGAKAPPFEACSGELEFDFNAHIQSGLDPRLVPGIFVYGQFRFRDPFAASGEGVGWSNAIRFAIAP
jgi:hypothetical protein